MNYRAANISSSDSSSSTLDLETMLMMKSEAVQSLFSDYTLNQDQRKQISTERSKSEFGRKKILSLRKRA